MKLELLGLITFLLSAFHISAFSKVPKIINGHDTNITEVPWQLLQLIEGDQACGGVIIGANQVLTAAHCFALGDPTPAANTYRAGSSNRLSGGTIHNVEKYVYHPEFDYNGNYITHDIAIAWVKEPFEFSEAVQPIEIGEEEPNEGESALLSGWGIFKINGTETEVPVILQSITLPVVGREKCREWYSDYFWEVRDDMLCVGIEGGGFGSCNGDSGGPMVVNNKVVGVMSWMDPCARPHHPSVYTSVPHYKDWIQETLASG